MMIQRSFHFRSYRLRDIKLNFFTRFYLLVTIISKKKVEGSTSGSQLRSKKVVAWVFLAIMQYCKI
jgi:hypothetical protein